MTTERPRRKASRQAASHRCREPSASWHTTNHPHAARAALTVDLNRSLYLLFIVRARRYSVIGGSKGAGDALARSGQSAEHDQPKRARALLTVGALALRGLPWSVTTSARARVLTLSRYLSPHSTIERQTVFSRARGPGFFLFLAGCRAASIRIQHHELRAAAFERCCRTRLHPLIE